MRKAWLMATLTVAAASPALAAPPTQGETALIDKLAQQAHIVFVGRIERANASNTKGLAATPETALVRVEEALELPPALAGASGQVITIQLARSEALKSGARAIFFATGLLYGDHLAVREVGRLPASVDAPAVRKELEAVRQRAVEAALAARVEGAATVVVAKVVRIENPKPKRSSEHAPDLAPARLEVRSALKGQAKGTLSVWFARSGDEAWVMSPKLHVGEEAIFLVHAAEKGLPAGNYVLHPLDVQPLDKADVIRPMTTRGAR